MTYMYMYHYIISKGSLVCLSDGGLRAFITLYKTYMYMCLVRMWLGDFPF